LRSSLEENKKDTFETKAQLENGTMAAKDMESHYENLFKEKKQLEELIQLYEIWIIIINHRIANTIPNPEHSKLVKEIISLINEIVKLEKASAQIEENLLESESELKLTTKKNKSASEIAEQRKEVEKLRHDLGNAQTQLAIFIKRKALMQEELFHLEKMEKRRFEYGFDVEKSMAKVKKENSLSFLVQRGL
jgi:hypothetical protein